MKAAADALQKLAADPQYLGARLGILAVLHTWARAMKCVPLAELHRFTACKNSPALVSLPRFVLRVALLSCTYHSSPFPTRHSPAGVESPYRKLTSHSVQPRILPRLKNARGKNP